MRKVVTFLVILILACSCVLAQGRGDKAPEPELRGAPEDIPRPELYGADDAPEPELMMEQERAQMREQARDGSGDGEQAQEMKQTRTQAGEGMGAQNRQMLQQGLENALGNVKNENARQHLQQNMERFQERYQARLEHMEDVEVEEVDEETGAMKIRAREEVRFLGFIKGKATKRFEMDGQGNINEKAPWYRFMYREVSAE